MVPVNRKGGNRYRMLLFFDIDGTIFDDNRRLPPSVLPAMEEARRRGHRLLINTGRTLCNPDHRLDTFPLDGAVMGCGTRIVYRGETLQSMEYPPEASLRLRKIFLELKIPVVYECDTAMYFDPEAPGHPAMTGFTEWALRNRIYREVTKDDPEFRAVKMFCFTDSKKIRELEKRTAEAGMPYIAINRWPEGWELTPAAYSKGKGMDVLREKLGIPREDCYAFGDSNNDRTMFEHAGHSIAMGNAPDEVKALCTYVTARPEEDGIAKALKHFGLI